MGTVVEKIEYIAGTKEAIKTAIKNKGVAVADTDTFRSYADKIAEIEGGSGATFEAVNGMGEIPAAGTKVYVQPVNQESQFYAQFTTPTPSYYPRLLLNTVSIRGKYNGQVYSFDPDTGATLVYNDGGTTDFIKYLSNNRCYMQSQNSSNSPKNILKENNFSELSYSSTYAGILNDKYAFDSTTGVLKIYKFENDSIGEEVSAFPERAYPCRVIGLHNSEIFFIWTGNKVVPYQINLLEQTCTKLGDGSTVANVYCLAGVTLDNQYLVLTKYQSGEVYKINADYSLTLEGTISLDGNISFNPYNGILLTSHVSDNTLPPSMWQYADGAWTQLQFDTTGTTQPQFHSAMPTVNADASYLLSVANTASYLYQLEKTDGGYKAVACIKNNFTSEGFTAFVQSGDEDTLTLTTALPETGGCASSSIGITTDQ